MEQLLAVDRLEILILVDNSTDMLSTVKPSSESELSGHFKRGMRLIGGRCLCCAAHGFACLVTAWRNGSKRKRPTTSSRPVVRAPPFETSAPTAPMRPTRA